MRKRDPAFTLVELLVVVTIIGLLLMLLAPTIQMLNEHVQKLNCLRNLKQIQRTAMQYCDDNNGWLVRLRDAKIRNRFFSHELSETYMEGNYAIFSCPTVHDRHLALAADHEAVLDYGINHYGRPEVGSHARQYYPPDYREVSKRGKMIPWWHSFGNSNYPIRREWVSDATVIYFADADYFDSPHDIAGITTGYWWWPIRNSFSREAWNRHMGPNDPTDEDFQNQDGFGKQENPDMTRSQTEKPNATIWAFHFDSPLLDHVQGGYNAVSLDGGAKWRPGIKRANEDWFIKKHVVK